MRIYKFLLHFYPASFRAGYGEEMGERFGGRCREAKGVWAVAALWLSVFFEILANATAAHWDILRQDLRYTARALRRAPGFAIAAVLVVALGVGANTAAFSVADFVLIRPLPFAEPDRLVRLWEFPPGYGRTDLSPADYRDWKRMSTVFETMGATRGLSVNMIGQGDPELLEGAAMTADVLPMLGVQPMIGRLFTADEDRAGAPGTLLLSYRLWQMDFGGDPGVVGRKIRLDDKTYTVIGVMPRDFHFSNPPPDIWTPMRFEEEDFQDRNNNYLHAFARLKRGVSLDQAKAELAVVTGQLKRQYPKENGKTDANIYFLRDDLSRNSRLLLLELAGPPVCVLLLLYANPLY